MNDGVERIWKVAMQAWYICPCKIQEGDSGELIRLQLYSFLTSVLDGLIAVLSHNLCGMTEQNHGISAGVSTGILKWRS
jgi:hypothetical protein